MLINQHFNSHFLFPIGEWLKKLQFLSFQKDWLAHECGPQSSFLTRGNVTGSKRTKRGKTFLLLFCHFAGVVSELCLSTCCVRKTIKNPAGVHWAFSHKLYPPSLFFKKAILQFQFSKFVLVSKHKISKRRRCWSSFLGFHSLFLQYSSGNNSNVLIHSIHLNLLAH